MRRYHNQRPTIPATCPPPMAAVLRRAWMTEARHRPEFRDIVAWYDLNYASLLNGAANDVDDAVARRLEGLFSVADSVPSGGAGAATTLENSRGYVAHVAQTARGPGGGGGAG